MTKFLKRSAILLGSLVMLTALSACETEEDRAIAAGQSCLDRARTSTDADQCINLVQNINTEQAYLIRCSANFVAQGFTGTRIANAFEGMNGGGGSDPMIGMLAFLVFSNTNPNHTAAQAVSNCEKSGVRSMLRLATAAQLATTVGSALVDPTSPGAAAQMQAQIDTLIASGAKDAEIGNIALVANQAYCSEGSTYSTNEVCENLRNAIAAGGGNAAAIGAKFLDELKLP